MLSGHLIIIEQEIKWKVSDRYMFVFVYENKRDFIIL